MSALKLFGWFAFGFAVVYAIGSVVVDGALA
mgnify:CR=1 FL=1